VFFILNKCYSELTQTWVAHFKSYRPVTDSVVSEIYLVILAFWLILM